MSFRAEAGALIALTIPIVAGLLGEAMLTAADGLMLGPLGKVPLAAASLTQSVLVIFSAALYGLVSAAGVLTANAYGGADFPRAASTLKYGYLLGFGGGLLGAVAMAWLIKLLPATGQPAEVLEVIEHYWMLMSAVLIPFTLLMVVKQFLDSIDRPWMGALLCMVPAAINVPLNWMLIYGKLGFPALGLAGAGYASLAAYTLGFILAAVCVAGAPTLKPYRNAYRMSHDGFSEVVREGYPMMVQYLAEGGAVAVAGLLIGIVGTVALAANQIVFSVGYLVYMVPLGIAAAVSIRVAQASGEGSPARIRSIGLAGMVAVTAWTLPFTALMLFGGRAVARLFVDDDAVIEAAAAIFVAVGIFQFFDGLQSVSLGALRGMLDRRWPTAVSLIAYWLVALPLGALLAFRLGFGAPGVWAGFGFGLAVAGLLLLARFLHRTRAG